MKIEEALELLIEYAHCGLAANGRDTEKANEWAAIVRDELNDLIQNGLPATRVINATESDIEPGTPIYIVE